MNKLKKKKKQLYDATFGTEFSSTLLDSCEENEIKNKTISHK
jgi:hypothetical protein